MSGQRLIGFNPLHRLKRDDAVAEMFWRLLDHRLDTRILSGHFKVGRAFETFRFPDGRRSRAEHVSSVVSYLISAARQPPDLVSRAYRKRFTIPGSKSPGVPLEIIPSLKRYFEKKEYVTDVPMVEDLFLSEHLRGGVIADVGCGRNRLGRALLHVLDARLKKGHSWRVIGTDVNRYDFESPDPRLEYRQQMGVTDLPFETGSVQWAVVKWALHHMPPADLKPMMKELRRILAPNGRLIVIEALMGSWAEHRADAQAEQQNRQTWPKGGWQKERWQFSRDYLELSLRQQRELLAMEDFYGHWLEHGLLWMPLPFTYLASADWIRRFGASGLTEARDQRRVFGMMPILHWGPPSIRMVFVKDEPTARRARAPLGSRPARRKAPRTSSR